MLLSFAQSDDVMLKCMGMLWIIHHTPNDVDLSVQTDPCNPASAQRVDDDEHSRELP